jgi:hypothetical protein
MAADQIVAEPAAKRLKVEEFPVPSTSDRATSPPFDLPAEAVASAAICLRWPLGPVVLDYPKRGEVDGELERRFLHICGYAWNVEFGKGEGARPAGWHLVVRSAFDASDDHYSLLLEKCLNGCFGAKAKCEIAAEVEKRTARKAEVMKRAQEIVERRRKERAAETGSATVLMERDFICFMSQTGRKWTGKVVRCEGRYFWLQDFPVLAFSVFNQSFVDPPHDVLFGLRACTKLGKSSGSFTEAAACRESSPPATET